MTDVLRGGSAGENRRLVAEVREVGPGQARGLARLLEELADTGGAEPREHLDERGGALRVEVRARRACDRLREQGLPGAGRAVEEDTARDARAEPLEALAVAQELDDLVKLLLRLVEARDVAPGDV